LQSSTELTTSNSPQHVATWPSLNYYNLFTTGSWHRGYGAGLATKSLQIKIPVKCMPSDDYGNRASCSHTCLCYKTICHQVWKRYDLSL